MIEKLKVFIQEEVSEYYFKTNQKQLNIVVEEPKNPKMGDLAIPIFTVAKSLNQPFNECGREMTDIINQSSIKEYIDEIKLIGGFLNLTVKKAIVGKAIIEEVLKKGCNYGQSEMGKEKVVVIEYSAPNIAKPFSIGHLRSTIIGHSLAKLHDKCGYNVHRINHLGDWGTQFGKLIVAYKLWGNQQAIEEDPIEELLRIYVHFHDEAEHNPQLIEEGRKAFAELEQGNEEYLHLWEWFRKESLKKMMKMYDLLGVDFDSYKGEAFYVDQFPAIIEELKSKQLLIEDDGAQIVRLENMPPALIQKTDGSTLYITRDIAAALYRMKNYQFDKMLYVVGNEQTLHFEQLKQVLMKMNYNWYQKIHHINFGLVLQNGKKMATRKGRIVRLEEVIEEAINLAYEHVNDKNPQLTNKEEIAKSIGVSSIIFNDLKNYRTNEIDFNLNQMLQFEGTTGPYLQYTSVRISSILKTTEVNLNGELDDELFKQEHYFAMIRLLGKFQTLIEEAALDADPSIIAKYALKLAGAFNSFYSKERILVENKKEKATKVALAYAVRTVLDECMRLLGMNVIREM